ncbi:MAG: thioredoxin family protein [Gemmatimonadaceae bacterium]|nr:thioredoxin family protein [Gemmatimonadaceae bacterium]
MSDSIVRAGLRERYIAAPDFAEMLESARQNVELWSAVSRRASVDEAQVQRVAALGGERHLLVLSEDWCGDAVNTLPVIARLAGLAPNLDLRILPRDENLDLMDAHLSGTSRSIPVAIALDADYVERGWWGPRPADLQQWVLTDGRSLNKDARYREIRRWYARDRGRTTILEVVALLERAAGIASTTFR